MKLEGWWVCKEQWHNRQQATVYQQFRVNHVMPSLKRGHWVSQILKKHTGRPYRCSPKIKPSSLLIRPGVQGLSTALQWCSSGRRHTVSGSCVLNTLLTWAIAHQIFFKSVTFEFYITRQLFKLYLTCKTLKLERREHDLRVNTWNKILEYWNYLACATQGNL